MVAPGVVEYAVSFINNAEMLSGPTALWGLIFLSNLATPLTCTVISALEGWGLGLKSGMCSSCTLHGVDGSKLFVQYINLLAVYQAIFCDKRSTIVVTPLTFDKTSEAYWAFVKVRSYYVSVVVVVCTPAWCALDLR